MLPPPPYIFGAPKYWVTSPFRDDGERAFPVSTELYVALDEAIKRASKRLKSLKKVGHRNKATDAKDSTQSLVLVVDFIATLLFSIQLGTTSKSGFG